MRLALSLFIFAAFAFGQTTHSVTLNWTDTVNPSGTTYKPLRATGLCSGSPVFSSIASGIATKTYIDTTVVPGNFCYVVRAVYNSLESADSNSVLAAVPAFAVTGFTGVLTGNAVNLSWVDVLNPPGRTFKVYRAPGLCSGSPVFAVIATGLTNPVYSDPSMSPGSYCYSATATVDGMESVQSGTVQLSVPAAPPTSLSLTVQ